MQELTFEVREDDGGSGWLCARAVGAPIFTQGRDWTHLRAMVKEAVECHFEESSQLPRLVRLHFVRDEVLAL